MRVSEEGNKEAKDRLRSGGVAGGGCGYRGFGPLGRSEAGRNWFPSRWGLTCCHGLIIGLLAVALGLGGVAFRCVDGLGAPTGLDDGLTGIHTYRKTVVI